MNTREQYEKIVSRIGKYQNQLKKLQETCLHPELRGKFGSNTGHLCEDDNMYWIDFRCPDCEKQWTEDSSDYRWISIRDSLLTKDGFRFQVVDNLYDQ